MSIAAGIIVNGAYAEHLPGWLASVEALRHRPDEVVAVTDLPRKTFPSWVRTVRPPQRAFDWCAWRNLLADAVDADWLAWVDVDDRYRPHALDGCESWTADVVAFGMSFAAADGVQREWRPHAVREAIAEGETNHVPNGSPVRVELARAVRWQPRFWPFSDWGFWVQAAHAGASFAWTGRIDFDYRWHADTPVDPELVRAEIAAWKAEEGIA